MNNKNMSKEIITIILQVIIVLFLLVWSFQILEPMLLLSIWGGIIAVGIYPLYERVTKVLKGKKILTATLFCLIGLILFITPLFILALSTKDSVDILIEKINTSNIDISQPSEKLRTIPYIGEHIFKFWSDVTSNISGTVSKTLPVIKDISPRILGVVGGIGAGIFETLISIVIASILLIYGEGIRKVFDKIFKLLFESFDPRMMELSINTIRGVVQGILGVGVIQGILAGLALFLFKVPGAGILTVLTIMVSVIQLPPFIVLGPVSFYIFSTGNIVGGVIFFSWSVFVSVIDTFIKPFLMGKNIGVPTLIVFIGAMGGLIKWGIIGMFIGAVALSIGYRVAYIILWTDEEKVEEEIVEELENEK